jgi:hypothetical protein
MKNARPLAGALATLAALSLACAPSAVAAPDQPGPAPAERRPAPDACRPGGAVLFQIDQRAEPDARLPTSTTKVFANGAWTRDETDADGKALAPRAGCLAKADLKQLETTLRGAPWKITVAQVSCMAMSPAYTVFHVDGKQVFTKRLCSRESLDDKSRSKLDAATAQIEREVGRRTSP